MKNPILVSILVLSILLNAAGIVFFVLFLTEHGHYKSARKEKAVLERNLAFVQSSSMMNQLNQGAGGPESCQKRLFVSKLDGEPDFFAFQPPAANSGSLDYTLCVYLHGMGSNQMEPFVIPAGQSIAQIVTSSSPRLVFLSPSYRKEASWGNDAAIADIVQNIREMMEEYPIKKIVLMGTSMGACVSLNFACLAPEDIKSKIAGVVSMEGAGDLTSLYSRTHADAIRPAMMLAFGGPPEQAGHIYFKKSFLSNIDSLSKSARIYVLSAKGDTVVPPELQQKIVEESGKRGLAVHFDEIDGPHEAPPASYYLKGLNFVLGNPI